MAIKINGIKMTDYDLRGPIKPKSERQVKAEQINGERLRKVNNETVSRNLTFRRNSAS